MWRNITLALLACFVFSSFYEAELTSISYDPEKIKFWLFPDKKNTTYKEEIIFGNVSSLQASSFKPGEMTVMLTHGFIGHLWHLQDNIHEYLESGFPGNILVLDWRKLSGEAPSPLDLSVPILYYLHVQNLPVVAQRGSGFIQWLIQEGVLDKTKLHLIGQSMGAHVVGAIGYFVQLSMDNYKIPRITGLDPAGIGMYPSIRGRNIQREDAEFVDIIHTSVDFIGDMTLDGHVDIFPIGPLVIPECGSLAIFCRHNYAVELYRASFKYNLTACRCYPQCPKERYTTYCDAPILLGVNCPTSARGVYYLEDPPKEIAPYWRDPMGKDKEGW